MLPLKCISTLTVIVYKYHRSTLKRGVVPCPVYHPQQNQPGFSEMYESKCLVEFPSKHGGLIITKEKGWVLFISQM